MKKIIFMIVAFVVAIVAQAQATDVLVGVNYLTISDRQIVINDENTISPTDMREFANASALYCFLLTEEQYEAEATVYAYNDGFYAIQTGTFKAVFNKIQSRVYPGAMRPSERNGVWASYDEPMGGNEVKYVYGLDAQGRYYLVVYFK